MDATRQVIDVLIEVLSLGERGSGLQRDTPLLGSIPELDSMAVVSLITAFEERLGIEIDDDDIDASLFASVGSLADFVSGRVNS